jgi:hypothetical protein
LERQCPEQRAALPGTREHPERIFRFFLVKLIKARRMLANNRKSQSKFMPVLHGPQFNNTFLAYPPTDILTI